MRGVVLLRHVLAHPVLVCRLYGVAVLWYCVRHPGCTFLDAVWR